jgi:hypothetical protein
VQILSKMPILEKPTLFGFWSTLKSSQKILIDRIWKARDYSPGFRGSSVFCQKIRSKYSIIL